MSKFPSNQSPSSREQGSPERVAPNGDTPDATELFVVRINASWQKSVAAIIETGRILIEAKKAITPGEFQNLFRTELVPHTPIHFSLRTAEMLMRVAKNKVLSDPKHVSHLPASWGTLYELSKIPDRELLDLIKRGMIHPDLERKDVKAFGFSFELEPVSRALDKLIECAKEYPEPEDIPRLVDDIRLLSVPAHTMMEDNVRQLKHLAVWIEDLYEEFQGRYDKRERADRERAAAKRDQTTPVETKKPPEREQAQPKTATRVPA